MLCMSMASTHAFNTDPSKIAVIVIHDAAFEENLTPGTWVNFTVIVKNLSNDTMRNVNISQSFPRDLHLVVSPFGQVNANATLNITSPATISMPTGGTWNITKGFANSSYYEFSFPSLVNGSSISYTFSLNATFERVFDINPPKVEYLDHWGDPYTVSGNRVSLEFSPPEEKQDIEKYYPEFEVKEPDWELIIGTGLTLVASATVISALVYFRRPLSSK